MVVWLVNCLGCVSSVLIISWCVLISCGQYGGMVGWATGMCYKCVCVLVEAARGNVSA